MRASYGVGLDVGGTRMAAGLVHRKGRLVKEVMHSTPKGGPFGVVDTIIEAIGEVTAGLHSSEIAGVGIGLPAQMDFGKQTVEFCTNLPLAGVDVRGLVMSRIKQSVTLDNDGHMAAIGEARVGAAKGARDFTMITLGTGVGGALFVGGQPYRGHRGLGGEIGHMVVDLDGPKCPCGGTGHLEALVGREAILRAARESAASYKGAEILRRAGGDPDKITTDIVIDVANEGDEAAGEIMSEVGRVLGEAMVGIVNLLNPQLLVIGGGIGERYPVILDKVSAAIAATALAGRRDVTVVPAQLGNEAGMVGAAFLAFDEHDSREGARP